MYVINKYGKDANPFKKRIAVLTAKSEYAARVQFVNYLRQHLEKDYVYCYEETPISDQGSGFYPEFSNQLDESGQPADCLYNDTAGLNSFYVGDAILLVEEEADDGSAPTLTDDERSDLLRRFVQLSGAAARQHSNPDNAIEQKKHTSRLIYETDSIFTFVMELDWQDLFHSVTGYTIEEWEDIIPELDSVIIELMLDEIQRAVPNVDFYIGHVENNNGWYLTISIIKVLEK